MKFAKFCQALSSWAGSSKTFLTAILLIAGWALTGPYFHYNDTWQLITNTSTTIITFLMVFLIQNTQNRDGAALHAKIDELIHAVKAADERFIGIEHLTEKELDQILRQVEARAARLHGKGHGALPVVATRAEDAQAGRSSTAAHAPRRPRRPAAKVEA